ncbi:hypothetical protein pb186bvf_000599 [Paramecium bursaria]
MDQSEDQQDNEGYIQIYQQEIPFKLKLNEEEYQQMESLNVKVLVMGGDQHLQQMKIELSSDSDLFFHFVHIVNQEQYQQIKEQQSITAQFIDYPAICVKSLDKAAKDSQQYTPTLHILEGGEARVDITQHTEYKDVELITFEFHSLEEDQIRVVISNRYQNLKSKLSQLEGKLRDINEVVKAKNPQLLLQMQKMKK